MIKTEAVCDMCGRSFPAANALRRCRLTVPTPRAPFAYRRYDICRPCADRINDYVHRCRKEGGQ